jgi:hypothetical protein
MCPNSGEVPAVESIYDQDYDPATAELDVIITGTDLVTVGPVRLDAVDGEPGGLVFVVVESADGNRMRGVTARVRIENTTVSSCRRSN